MNRNSIITNTRVSKLITNKSSVSASIQLSSLLLVTWVISSTVEISKKLHCSNSTILESARGYNFVKKEYFSDRCKPIVVQCQILTNCWILWCSRKVEQHSSRSGCGNFSCGWAGIYSWNKDLDPLPALENELHHRPVEDNTQRKYRKWCKASVWQH